MSATGCPSELTWTRHLAGELGWLATRRLRAHVAGCAGCRGVLDAMQAERADFDAGPRRQHDLAALRAHAGALVAGPGRSRRAWGLVGLAAAGAVAAAALAIRTPEPDGAWTAKGADLLTLHVDRAGGAAPLGATCAAGDRLMASYATGHAYLLLLERDGAGTVQVLFPQGGVASGRLAEPRGATAQSFVLDAVDGRECFAAFFSDAPIAAAQAGEALARGGGAPALPGAVTRVICCDKQGAR